MGRRMRWMGKRARPKGDAKIKVASRPIQKGLEAEMASARSFVLPARRDECVQPSMADPLR